MTYWTKNISTKQSNNGTKWFSMKMNQAIRLSKISLNTDVQMSRKALIH